MVEQVQFPKNTLIKIKFEEKKFFVNFCEIYAKINKNE